MSIYGEHLGEQGGSRKGLGESQLQKSLPVMRKLWGEGAERGLRGWALATISLGGLLNPHSGEGDRVPQPTSQPSSNGPACSTVVSHPAQS